MKTYFICVIKSIIQIICVFILINSVAKAQRTRLDDIINFSIFQRGLVKIIKKTTDSKHIYSNLKKQGKLQPQFSSTTKFFCDTKNFRSLEIPKSVHKLRPGDIDIIGALGDSLTAGIGIMATNILQISIENRGISWSGGGQGTWRNYLTIPNILKEFNPNLYGYSLKDSFSIDKASMFNVAELGAMSRDVPYMTKVLIKRLQNDPKVNMSKHWKLITLFIGNNDFCADMCYYDKPEKVVDMHERDLVETLRLLRDNIPNVMVNVLPPPNLILLTQLKGKPGECHVTHRLECPCLIGRRIQPYIKSFIKIMNKWQEREREIIYRDEFNNETFTVNYQPFTTNLKFPKINDQYDDFRYLSTDCFHLSQKGQARAANAMWNNMLEPINNKSTNWRNEFEYFKCPTEDQPYLMTRINSIQKIE